MYYLHNQSQEMATHMFCQMLCHIYIFFLLFFFYWTCFCRIIWFYWTSRFYISYDNNSFWFLYTLIFISYFYFYTNFVWSKDSQYTTRKIKVIILSNFGFPRVIPAAMWPHLILISLFTKKKNTSKLHMNIVNYYLTWENKIYNLLQCHKKMEFWFTTLHYP